METLSNEELFLQKKIELMIEMGNKKLKAELEAMKSMMERMSLEISELKKGAARPEPKTLQSFEPVKKAAPEPQKDSSSLKPRYGDYKPGDIDIKDFFYFGGGGGKR